MNCCVADSQTLQIAHSMLGLASTVWKNDDSSNPLYSVAIPKCEKRVDAVSALVKRFFRRGLCKIDQHQHGGLHDVILEKHMKAVCTDRVA